MLRVILVDDEDINLALLKKIIPWRELGFEIVGTAQNGEEGLALAARVMPDLAIIDIRMPILNGMDMIKRIKQSQPSIKIIILSAYGEFEYAQQAIEYGIDAYLLKPMDENKLIAILHTMKEQWSSRQKEEEARFWHSYLTDELSDEVARDGLRQLADNYNITSYLVAHINMASSCIDHMTASAGSTGRQARSAEEQTSAIETLARSVHSSRLMLSLDGCSAVVLYYAKIGMDLVAPHRIADWLRAAAESKRLEDGSVMMCGISQPFQYLSDVKEAVHQASLANAMNFYPENKGSIVYTAAMAQRTSHSHDHDELEWHISQGLQTGKYPLVLEYIERTFHLFDSRRIAAEDVYLFCNRLLIALSRELNRMDCREGAQYLAPFIGAYVQSFAAFGELKKFMLKTTMHIGSIIHPHLSSNRNYAVVRKAKEYALLHFGETDFSIKQVADYVGLSKNHFSRLFKDSADCNYWDYVIQLRMEEAKRQLRQTNRTNYEIAQNIGYSSEYHFSRTFAKVEGMTTSQYRKIHAQ